MEPFIACRSKDSADCNVTIIYVRRISVLKSEENAIEAAPNTQALVSTIRIGEYFIETFLM